ncbi:hypothetical protein [Hyphomicrobium sp.]|uniref:hypothetical protein n=1 Tax=Hyphomicrobium sp. TaxID=82 RepID=UPI000F99BFE2|nr:hypothetical protein [Hyphomicrobium sp.]RUP08641.1 MAG: hypothetical protein EKK38_12890 [Hyphomicrobium sp.]
MIRQALRRVTSPTTHADDISWRVGVFAVERLRSDPDSWLAPNVLWAEYFCWCKAKDVQPLPAANFLRKFDEAAVSLGARKFRAGDTIGYARIAFKPAS